MATPTFEHFLPLALRLVLAFVIGACIGFDRELHGHPAGLRTHILVCLGACLIATVDSIQSLAIEGRIAAQIITGVGFLGAGTIIRSEKGFAVRGLTTAASLWCVAGMGIALGYGGLSTWLAVTAALIVLLTLTLVSSLEKIAIRHSRDRSLTIYLKSPDQASASTASSEVLDSLANMGVKVRRVQTDKVDGNPLAKVLHLNLRIPKDTEADSISSTLHENAQVTQFSWDQ